MNLLFWCLIAMCAIILYSIYHYVYKPEWRAKKQIPQNGGMSATKEEIDNLFYEGGTFDAAKLQEQLYTPHFQN